MTISYGNYFNTCPGKNLLRINRRKIIGKSLPDNDYFESLSPELSFVKEALHEVGISGMTVSDVKGFGRQRGSTGGIDKPDEYDDEFLVKMKLEVIVEDEDAEKVSEAIKKAAYSGKIGDGKIFIYNIDQVIRIRTGEKDSDAV